MSGLLEHGTLTLYKKGCTCSSCRRENARITRAKYETACAECGGPCWGRYAPGRRCQECVRLGARSRRPLQPSGLRYQWGCP